MWHEIDLELKNPLLFAPTPVVLPSQRMSISPIDESLCPRDMSRRVHSVRVFQNKPRILLTFLRMLLSSSVLMTNSRLLSGMHLLIGQIFRYSQGCDIRCEPRSGG